MPEISALDFTQNSETGQLEVDGETKDLLKSLGVCCCRHNALCDADGVFSSTPSPSMLFPSLSNKSRSGDLGALATDHPGGTRRCFAG